MKLRKAKFIQLKQILTQINIMYPPGQMNIDNKPVVVKKSRKAKFIEILTPIINIINLSVKTSTNNNHPAEVERDHPKDKLFVVNRTEGRFEPIIIDEYFLSVRKEIESNLPKPIDVKDQIAYLKEIFDFYSEIEDKIREAEEDGYLSSELVKFIKATSQMQYDLDDYEEILNKLKDRLGEEIVFIHNEISKLKNTKEQYFKSLSEVGLGMDLSWAKDKVDLIELARALCLSGAIRKSEDKGIRQCNGYSVIGSFDYSS